MTVQERGDISLYFLKQLICSKYCPQMGHDVQYYSDKLVKVLNYRSNYGLWLQILV